MSGRFLGGLVKLRDLAAAGGALLVGFLQTGVGAILRTLADRARENVSPLDFMTSEQREDVLTGVGLIDVTAAINTACATGKNLVWPDGVFRIEGTITGGAGGWYGKGQSSDAYGSVWNGSGTFLRVIGANGGAAHIKPPRDFEGFHIDGVDKTAIGVDLGQNASFTAFQRWKRITIRSCADALRGFNFYSTSLEDVIIQGNVRGITIAPTDGAGDDGYFTASQWKNVHIADNDVYGLNVDVPQGTRTWTWENVVIERNGTSGGTYQARLKNAKVTGNGIYIEAAPGVPGLKTEVASLFGCDWYFNGTGGIDASNQSLVMGVELLQMTGASDVLANIPSIARLSLKNSNIRTDVRTAAYVVELQNVNISGVADQQYNRVGRMAIGQAPGSTYQPTETRLILSGKKTYTGTINAGSGVNIVGDQYFPGIMSDSAGFGSVQGYHPGLLVQVLPATTGNTDYYCVRLVNTTAANITLTAVQVNWTILRAIPQAL